MPPPYVYHFRYPSDNPEEDEGHEKKAASPVDIKDDAVLAPAAAAAAPVVGALAPPSPAVKDDDDGMRPAAAAVVAHGGGGGGQKLSARSCDIVAFIAIVVAFMTIVLVLVLMLYTFWNGLLLRLTGLVNPMSTMCAFTIVVALGLMFSQSIGECIHRVVNY